MAYVVIASEIFELSEWQQRGRAGEDEGRRGAEGRWVVSGEWVLCVASVAYFLEGHCGCFGFCKLAVVPLVFLFASQIEDYESSESSRNWQLSATYTHAERSGIERKHKRIVAE